MQSCTWRLDITKAILLHFGVGILGLPAVLGCKIPMAYLQTSLLHERCQGRRMRIRLSSLGILTAAAGLALSTACLSGETSGNPTQSPGITTAVTLGAVAATPTPLRSLPKPSGPVAQGATIPALHGTEAAPQPTNTPARPPEPTVGRRLSPPTPSFTPSQIAPISQNQLTEELKESEVLTFTWRTNFKIRGVPYREIISGGPGKDEIPALQYPLFEIISHAEQWLSGRSPVQFVEINGDARAYPLMILTWHEIINDVVGGVPIVITFCPLCNTGIVFNSTLEGHVLNFGTTGYLRFSNLIIFDRRTESWWQQATGDAIAGELTGKQLEFLPTSIVSFDDFKEAHPEGLVLSLETGYDRKYGFNPYYKYDSDEPYMYRGPENGQLPAMERVVSVDLGTESLSIPFSALEEEPVMNYTLDGRDLAVFYKKGTASALDESDIGSSKDVGATGVFEANLDGMKLTFHVDGEQIVDDQTGSSWNIFGQAQAGPLAGRQLNPVIHGHHLWFSWVVFKPDTIIYRGGGA